MKKEYLIITGFFILLYLLWYHLYPSTIAGMEEFSFYICTPDYFANILYKPGGLGLLTGNFLSQFYRWRELGAILQTIYILPVFFAYQYIFIRTGKKEYKWISFLFIILLIWVQLNGLLPGYSIQFIFFMGGITFYIAIKRSTIRKWVFLLFPLLFIWLVPAGCLLLFYTITFFLEYCIYDKKRRFLLWPMLGLLVAVILLLYWNHHIFIPGNERLFDPLDHSQLAMLFILYGSPIFILLIKTCKVQTFKWMDRITVILAVCLLPVLFYTNKTAREKEKRFAIEHDAMIVDWGKILKRISPEEAADNPLYLRYFLLASSEKGELPDNLFVLNPFPECFYFYRSKDPHQNYYNGLFYASLGIYNEAVRQVFEAGLMNEQSINFRTIRLMTDWYLKMGNIKLVEKYLTILSRSTCHNKWIQRREKALKELKQKPPITPDKSKHDVFIGAYPFATEMSELLKDDPANIRKQEYFLCALLLNKELDQFENALSTLPYRQQKQPLPQSFQEAICILQTGNKKERKGTYQLNPSLQVALDKYMQTINTDDHFQEEYNGSYWNYYYSY